MKLKDNEIRDINRYLDENLGEIVQNLWDDISIDLLAFYLRS